MKFSDVILEKTDYLALKKILNFHKYYHDYLQKDALVILRTHLDNARIYDTSEMPKGTVRLYSSVTVISRMDGRQSFQLVLEPDEENNGDKVSVRSILGSALIGRSVGDEIYLSNGETVQIQQVKWMVPNSQAN